MAFARLPDESRRRLVKQLQSLAGTMTTAVVSEITKRHDWFNQLGAEERSWVRVVATNGIESFINWFADRSDVDPANLFNAAPRALTRKISLNQTVDMIRTTIEVVETQINARMSDEDKQVMGQAVLYYSREVAFASAQVYARAAERRGKWDERIEALVVDAIVRGDSVDALLSRASALGWTGGQVSVAVGPTPPEPDLEGIRNAARQLGQEILAATHGDRLIVVLSDNNCEGQSLAERTIMGLSDWFGPGIITIGPRVDGIEHADESAKEALSGSNASIAWIEGPRVVRSRELLPERLLAGDQKAKQQLAKDIYRPLIQAGGDLLATCTTFLDNYGSVEASARALFVHANTVRYRLKRISEVTGCNPSSARESYVLRLAIAVGRLATNDK